MLVKLDFMSLGDGALQDLFEASLKKVMANIADVTTKADATRKITIEVTITPDENRTMAALNIAASTTLAHIRPVKAGAILQEKDGKLTALVSQEEERELPGNVTRIERQA